MSYSYCLDDLLVEFVDSLNAAEDKDNDETWPSIAKTCLENHGFDFTSAYDINEHIRAFEELLAGWKEKEEKLSTEARKVLIDAGATESQLD